MAKWSDVIGFAETKETKPGVWEETITERKYFGEMSRRSRRLQNSDGLNTNVNISNEMSIIADPFANENLQAMRYAKYMGAKWKVTNIEVQYPRLLLTLGDLYNA